MCYVHHLGGKMPCVCTCNENRQECLRGNTPHALWQLGLDLCSFASFLINSSQLFMNNLSHALCDQSTLKVSSYPITQSLKSSTLILPIKLAPQSLLLFNEACFVKDHSALIMYSNHHICLCDLLWEQSC